MQIIFVDLLHKCLKHKLRARAHTLKSIPVIVKGGNIKEVVEDVLGFKIWFVERRINRRGWRWNLSCWSLWSVANDTAALRHWSTSEALL